MDGDPDADADAMLVGDHEMEMRGDRDGWGFGSVWVRCWACVSLCVLVAVRWWLIRVLSRRMIHTRLGGFGFLPGEKRGGGGGDGGDGDGEVTCPRLVGHVAGIAGCICIVGGSWCDLSTCFP
jgi:hypothetical protein